MPAAPAPRRRSGGGVRFRPGRRITTAPTLMAAVRRANTGSVRFRSIRSPQIRGGSIRFTATSGNGAPITGTATIRAIRRRMVLPGRVEMMVFASCAAVPGDTPRVLRSAFRDGHHPDVRDDSRRFPGCQNAFTPYFITSLRLVKHGGAAATAEGSPAGGGSKFFAANRGHPPRWLGRVGKIAPLGAMSLVRKLPAILPTRSSLRGYTPTAWAKSPSAQTPPNRRARRFCPPYDNPGFIDQGARSGWDSPLSGEV